MVFITATLTLKPCPQVDRRDGTGGAGGAEAADLVSPFAGQISRAGGTRARDCPGEPAVHLQDPRHCRRGVHGTGARPAQILRGRRLRGGSFSRD